jgi:hypothetical protein
MRRTCKKIQIPAQKPATGQAIKNKRRSQRIAKMGFLFMVTGGFDCSAKSFVENMFLDWILWESAGNVEIMWRDPSALAIATERGTNAVNVYRHNAPMILQ